MFSVYDGKCLSHKAVHNWVEKFSQERSKVADDARPGRPVGIATEATVLRQQSEDFCVAGFEALVKRWENCISVGGGYVEEFFPFSRFEYHMFYVLYPFVTYLLALPRNNIIAG
jgi:hypothetical protein